MLHYGVPIRFMCHEKKILKKEFKMSEEIYYATHDHDGYKINKYAKIVRFDSYEKMESYLRQPYSGDDLHHIYIKVGEFGEFWLESYEPIHVGNQHIYYPFNYNQLSINKQPPSNTKATWVTPINADVYIAGLSQ